MRSALLLVVLAGCSSPAPAFTDGGADTVSEGHESGIPDDAGVEVSAAGTGQLGESCDASGPFPYGCRAERAWALACYPDHTKTNPDMGGRCTLLCDPAAPSMIALCAQLGGTCVDAGPGCDFGGGCPLDAATPFAICIPR